MRLSMHVNPAAAAVLAVMLAFPPAGVAAGFGSALEKSVPVETDAGVALLKARGNTLGGVLGMTPGGGCSNQGNALGSAKNRMDCAKQALEEKWREAYGEDIDATGVRLGIGYESLRFSRGTSAEELFEALNYLYAWAAQSARVKIGAQIRRESSATSRAHVPGTPENERYGPQLRQLEQNKDEIQREIAQLVEQVDPYEAAAAESELRYLKGTPTFWDKAERLADGVIRRLDASYDAKTFSNDTAAEYGERAERMQRKARELKAQVASLEVQQKDMEKRIEREASRASFEVEGGSSVDARLAGVAIISTHENVNVQEGYIEVAVLSAWSPELEKIGYAILTGRQVHVADQSGPKFLPELPEIGSARDYLLNLPIAGLNGSHLVINDEGQYEILGVSVFPSKSGGLSSRDSERSARFFARMHMDCAIWSKTVDDEKVAGGLQAGEEDFQVAKGGGLTDTTTSCGTPADEKSRVVFGEKDVMSQTFVHPDFGFPAVIQAYKLGALSAEASRNLLRNKRQLEMQALKTLQYEQGYDEAIERRVQQARTDPSERARGMADAVSSFNRQAEERRAESYSPESVSSQPDVREHSGVMRSYSGGRGIY